MAEQLTSGPDLFNRSPPNGPVLYQPPPASHIQQQEGVSPDSVFPQVFFHRIFHSVLFWCSRIIHIYHAHDQLIVIYLKYLTIPFSSNNSQSSSLFLSLHLKLFSNSGPRFFLVFSFHLLLDFLLMTQ